MKRKARGGPRGTGARGVHARIPQRPGAPAWALSVTPPGKQIFLGDPGDLAAHFSHGLTSSCGTNPIVDT